MLTSALFQGEFGIATDPKFLLTLGFPCHPLDPNEENQDWLLPTDFLWECDLFPRSSLSPGVIQPDWERLGLGLVLLPVGIKAFQRDKFAMPSKRN